MDEKKRGAPINWDLDADDMQIQQEIEELKNKTERAGGRRDITIFDELDEMEQLVNDMPDTTPKAPELSEAPQEPKENKKKGFSLFCKKDKKKDANKKEDTLFADEPDVSAPNKFIQKQQKPRATGRTAQIDLKAVSTGVLSQMAGRNLVSEDKYKKKDHLVVFLIILVVAVGCGTGYYVYKSMHDRNDVKKEIANIEAQKKVLQDKLSDLENSEEYLKEELDTLMKDKAYNRALQVSTRIVKEYPNTETAKYAEKQATEARNALEKLGIPESTSEDKLTVNYEDYKAVTYTKLASDSKVYRGQKVKIYGKIMQKEDGKDANIAVVRIAVDDDTSNQLVAQYEKGKTKEVEEGDYVNLGGIVVPDITFKTALGKTTLPAISAVYVDKVAD